MLCIGRLFIVVRSCLSRHDGSRLHGRARRRPFMYLQALASWRGLFGRKIDLGQRPPADLYLKCGQLALFDGAKWPSGDHTRG